MSRKEISIGIIGAGGAIGRLHARHTAAMVDGAALGAVYDINTQAAEQIAAEYGALCMPDADALITSAAVDAVLIASWDQTHAALVQKCITAGKRVFCEKPLATTLEDGAAVLAAEQSAKTPLVQVGFMRRFDAHYAKLKEVLRSGVLGAPLMAHCISRTPEVSAAHTTPMHITNIAIHEIDALRWLLEEEIVSGRVLFPRSTAMAKGGLKDPQLVLMQSESGVFIDVECSANSHYGYEVRCEIVCERGTISLPEPATPVVRCHETRQSGLFHSWSDSFVDAYRREIQCWVDGMRDGGFGSKAEYPTCWDGYAACAVADMLLRAQKTGGEERVHLPEKPAMYCG